MPQSYRRRIILRVIMNQRKIIITPDKNNYAESFVSELKKIISGIDAGMQISIAVSGGSTPTPVFEILAGAEAKNIPWDRIHIFWADERCVPPDDPESNFGMTEKLLLSKVEIPATNIHRIKGENNPADEAFRYENEIVEFTVSRNRIPRFDIILLGMGNDGHTASIFPDRLDLITADNTCATSVHPDTGQNRITLTGTAINNAANILFHVTGRNKSELVKIILNEEQGFEKFPAGNIKPVSGYLFWILDPGGAALL